MQEDRETRIDEDVEAHNVRNSTKNSAKARKDEGDDVEAHQTRNHTKNRSDEGDDVDAHMLLNHTKNHTKN